MNRMRTRLQVLGLLACVAALTGCPSLIPTPVLQVSPLAVDFGQSDEDESFTVSNTGSGSLTWTVEEVALEEGDTGDTWVAAELPWLTVAPTSGATTGVMARVTLTVNRTGLPAGVMSGVGVRVNSNGGTAVVRISLTVPSDVVVSPTDLGLPVDATSTQFSVLNMDTISRAWQVQYLTDASDISSVAAFPDWLTVSPTSGVLQPSAQEVVTLSWPAFTGDPQDFALLVTAGTDVTVVEVSFGGVDLVATPSPLELYGLGSSTTLTIQNNGDAAVSWQIVLRNLTDFSTNVPVTVSPQLGTTTAGAESNILVTADAEDTGDIIFGEGPYVLLVQTQDAALTVPIRIESVNLPEILVSQAPDTQNAFPPPVELTEFDLGDSAYQGEFYVANGGPAGSVLYFKITYEDKGEPSPLIESVLINSVAVDRGSTDGDENVFYVAERGDWIYGVPITVVINRNNMQEAVEYRTITVTAWNSTFQHTLDAVDPVELKVRVERPPIRFEGAQHRSRPPFMLRFVFLLRDSLGEAIDTRDPSIFAEVADGLTVYEDDAPLTTETNYFVTYAESLRYDVVMLLDYTGSMRDTVEAEDVYPSSADPLRELYSGAIGDADSEGTVGAFLRDLPESYQVALMEFHDRQQGSRVLHRFSTNDDSLIGALKGFALSDAAHGVSELYDALKEACEMLAEKDADAEPFITDADVRAIVFVSDGKNTSSTATPAEVISLAQELGIRLYPVSFGENANNVPLIAMASETGGHFYQAKTVSGTGRETLEALLVHDPAGAGAGAAGRVASELERQIVLTYVSPVEEGASGGHSYRLHVEYDGESGDTENDVRADDNLMSSGDVHAGQISLATSGISEGVAEVYVRAEYIPRDVSQFRFRIVTNPAMTLTTDNVALTGLLVNDDGTTSWRRIAEGGNIFRLVTDEAGYLPYGSFGNLLQITFEDVTQEFEVGIRCDNTIYGPPSNVFMQYPLESLMVGSEPDVVAVPLADIVLVEDQFDPAAAEAFDADGDGTRDFDDPKPLDADDPPYLVSPSPVAFGASDSQVTVTLYNGRFDAVSWLVTEAPAGLSFSKGTASAETLAVCESQEVVVSLNRSVYAPGTYERTFTLLLTNPTGLSTERVVTPVTFSVSQTLSVTPTELSFPTWVDSVQFTVKNTGTDDFTWEIVVKDPNQNNAVVQPGFMTFDPPFTGDPPRLTGSTAAGGSTPVTLAINRDDPDLGLGTHAYTLSITAATAGSVDPPVASVSRGSASVPVEITVAGTPLLRVQHEGRDIDIAEGLWMLTGEETLSLTLLNEGDEPLAWSMSLLYMDDPSILAAGLPITIAPSEGSVPSGGRATVVVSVDQRTLFDVLAEGNHAFQLSIEWDAGIMDIPLTVNLLPLPVIDTVKPPEPNLADPPVEYLTTLDFGTDEYQMVFHVANVGHQDSELFFRIEYDDQFSTTPLIAEVKPLEGAPENDPDAFYFSEGGKLIATLPIAVTIDRNNIEGAVDERKITIVSMDSTFSRELAAVERKEITVRVERPPLQVEGAQNRSRPPFMLRFVFLLRDGFGNAINTLDSGVFAALQNAFTVYEDDQLLPQHETNHFVTYAQDLRYDLVLLLDYTGSMYDAARAAFPDSLDPLQELYAGARGDASDEGVAGAFLRDLPDSYNIALMEYHDRQQDNRLIHGFHTSDDALIGALKDFSVPPGSHGASELYDALVEACGRLTEKDAGALPLVEDADVRAVVFISDGWDTSSTAALADVITAAQESRARLYPIGFGEDVDLAGLIQLAEETGGHFYRAPKLQDATAQDLMDLLVQDTQTDEDDAPGRVASELARQIVLTYVTLLPGSHTYEIQVDYEGDTGYFQRDGVLDNYALEGDVRAGQISLSTTGVSGGAAEHHAVYVRAEYIPRNVSQFRFRFIPSSGVVLGLDDVELTGLLSDDGVPPDDWRVISEGNNVFSVVTDEQSFLPYGSFGDLLRITFQNVTEPFTLGIRVDNSVYSNPPYTTFFQYPLTDLLVSGGKPDMVAVGLEDIYLVADGFDPDAEGAFDADGDGTRDFDDPMPLDAAYPPPFAAPTTIDLGAAQTAAALTLTNQRFEGVTWSVSNDVPWLTVSPASGTLAVGEEGSATVTVDRSGLAPGVYSDTFSFELRPVGGTSVERRAVLVSVTVPASLRVTPSQVSFPASVSAAELLIGNVGTEAFDWIIEAVDPSDTSQTISLPAPLTLVPAASGTTAGGGQSSVTVSVNRTGLALGTYNYMLRVRTSPDAGSQLIPVALVVAGTPNLAVDEGDELWMLTGEGTASLTLRNTGDDLLTWSITMVHAPEEGVSLPVETMPIQVSPASGTIPAAAGGVEAPPASVTITVDQVELLELFGEGRQRFQILIAWDRGVENVWLYVDLAPMPAASVDRTALDFGTDPNLFQLTFYVGNPGALYSKLHYAFEVLGEDNANTPLITTIYNEEESSAGVLWRTDPLHYPEHEITVSIDRSVLNETVEYRTIRVYDTEIPAVEPVEVQVRVEQTPLTIEGAINRSRPPYVMRFVFLLRDMLGQAIPTMTEEDLANLDFVIEEDGIALDPDETSQFVVGPQHLKYNLVLLLDYTGSMYNAGVGDASDPLAPGEAIGQMVEGAKGFIDDLPEGYRVALMEYHDRQQGNRVLHGFTTNKESLKDAVSAFSLPPAEHGASEVLDALAGAADLLVQEDPEDTIPFDDADVRAVVFVSDGWDTSSVSTQSEVVNDARDARVRFYPVGFSGGDTLNTAMLVDLASKTGGHVYYAQTADSLTELLANELGLALDDASVAGLEATFNICDVGGTSLPWTLEYTSGSWLSVDLPHLGTVTPGQCYPVRVVADDTGLPPGLYTEEVHISADTTASRGGVTEPVTLNAAATASLSVVAGADSELTLALSDEPGRVWRELRNQVVLTYVSLFQSGSHTYLVRAKYTDEGNDYFGSFEEDAVYWSGDVRQGQISLYTTGISRDAASGGYGATAYVRTDYVPRSVNEFRLRFFIEFTPPADAPAAAQAAMLAGLPSIANATVALVPDGLVANWRLIPQGDGVYTILTEQSDALQYGAFGNLLTVTFTGLDAFVAAFDGLAADPSFTLGFRVDNALYYSPAVPPSTPSTTKYFVYPGGHLNRGRGLIIGMESDTATPAGNPLDLTVTGFDPEDPLAWDSDEDGVLDFDDPDPEDEEVPGAVLSAQTLSIGASATTGTFTIRNARFDTLTWTVVEAPLWVVEPSVGQEGTLAPGESTDVGVTVDRTGLPSGLTSGVIVIETDVGETELTVNLNVP